LFHCAADVDEIIGDHTEPDPTFHSIVTFVPAAIETVPPLGHTDAPLASGSPFLAGAEPSLLLLASTLDPLGRPIGDTDAFDRRSG